MTTATRQDTATLEEKWQKLVPTKWLPFLPGMDVVMLHIGDTLRLGDFQISSNKVLYAVLGRPVTEAGIYFRYHDPVSKTPVPDYRIYNAVYHQLECLDRDRREKQHQARLALAELAAEYRSITGQASRAAWRKVILDTIASNDYGCNVKFDETTGNVIFFEDGE